MNMKRGQYIGFGDEKERIYAVVETDAAGENEIVVLPACAMRLRPETVLAEWTGELPPDDVMADFIRYWDRNGAIDVANDTVLQIYHLFAERLSEINNPIGLAAKAYGCYGGYNSFECDWEASRECLLKLLEIDYKPFYADTLGYIYYYGRCNGGVPEYPEAYKYFSMAAFAGNYEATYKIADMFFNGYYVPRNMNTAIGIVRRLYDDNLQFIMRGEFLSSFADIALRMGNMLRQVLDMRTRSDAFEVYRYLLQAEFAIRMRIDTYDQSYGDDRVLKNARKALKEVRDICHELQDPEDDFLFTIGLVTLSMPQSTVRMHVEYKDTVIVRFTTEYDDVNKVQPRFLLTIPDNDYCGLCDELVFSVEKHGEVLPEGDILFDSINDHELFFGGKRVAKIDSCFELLSPVLNDEPVFRIVRARFEQNGELIDYICDDHNVKVGDVVIVPFGSGQRNVSVEKVTNRKASELAKPVDSYVHVTRKGIEE